MPNMPQAFSVQTALDKCSDIWKRSDELGEVIPPRSWFSLDAEKFSAKLIDTDHAMLDAFEPKLQALHFDLMTKTFTLQELFFIRERAFFATTQLEDVFANRANRDVEWVAKTHSEEHLVYWLLTVPWWCFCEYQLRLTAEDLLNRYQNVKLTNEDWWRNPKPPYWD